MLNTGNMKSSVALTQLNRPEWLHMAVIIERRERIDTVMAKGPFSTHASLYHEVLASRSLIAPIFIIDGSRYCKRKRSLLGHSSSRQKINWMWFRK
jgi:hypothetical protein